MCVLLTWLSLTGAACGEVSVTPTTWTFAPSTYNTCGYGPPCVAAPKAGPPTPPLLNFRTWLTR